MNLKQVIYCLIFAVLFSCKKNPSNGTDTNPVSPPEIKYDSVNLVRMISHSNGAMISFSYDTLSNRLVSYHKPYSVWDSTEVSYDNAGRIKALWYRREWQSFYQGHMTILNYSSDGRLMKVFHKSEIYASQLPMIPNYKTDTTKDVSAYDSLVYNSKNQLIASYYIVTWAPPDRRILSHYTFTYHPYNDSLVHTVKYFEARDSWNYELRLQDSVTFESYDNRPNPFYRDFKYSGIFANFRGIVMLTYAHEIPMRFRQFLTLSPQNCTKMKVSLYSSIHENYSIRYTYLPPDSRVDSFILNTNSWNFSSGVIRYTKQRVRR
jgi:hypothetical protein